jgi:hypothetical protein
MLHSNSNWGGICGACFLLLLCVAILALSEYEDEVRDFVCRCLGHIAAPSPEEASDYEYR